MDVFKRRSIRKYTAQEVTREEIQELLDAAMSAPSAGNEQPWQFVVVTERRLLDLVPTVHPYADMIVAAPAAVIVCGDLNLDRFGGFWVQDCAAATENLLVHAAAMGLGAVWLGVHPLNDRVEGLRRIFSLPDHVVPLAVIPLGHPAESKTRARRYQESRVHWNGW